MDQTPEFKIIPDTSDVTELNRDLQFHPCTNAQPQTLTQTQIEAYNNDGYIRPIRVFDEAEALENRRYLDDLMAKVLASGKDSYSISTAHLTYGKV